jgi:two-component system NtrC family sensor kinase
MNEIASNTPSQNGKLRVSIRYKILALMGGLLIAAMGAYLWLAIDLFEKDKLAYVYDLNSTLAKTVGEEVRSAIGSLKDKLDYLALLHGQQGASAEGATAERTAEEAPNDPERSSQRAGEETALARKQSLQRDAELLFGGDPDILAVEVWYKQDKEFERAFRWQSEEHLQATSLLSEDLQQARKTVALPWSTIVTDGVYLRNASLPPDMAILVFAVSPPGSDCIAVAEIRPDRFLRIFAGSEIYKIYLVDARGEVLAHPEPRAVIGRADLRGLELVRKALEGQPHRGVVSFRDPEGRELIGGFFRLDESRVSVLTEIPRDEALRAGRVLAQRSQLFAIGIVLAALLLSIFFSRRLSAPLRRLEAATRSVAQGDLGVSVQVKSRDEVGSLARSFNRMAGELLQRDRQLEEANQQLIQSEKLAAVGELSAAISHEVKNPLAGIRGFAQLGKSADDVKECKEYFEIIEKETARAKDTLENVLGFTRQQTVDFSQVNANQVVRDTLRLVAHQLQMKRVALHFELDQSQPTFHGNANQIQQVLLNLILNAQDAMVEEGGVLTVSTSQREKGGARIQVSDTGNGIPEEIKANIFRPFVTTKPKGRGTGLGLSVSKRIVEAHNGEISVQSEEGLGTTFSVDLPGSS